MVTQAKELFFTHKELIEKLFKYVLVRGLGVLLYAGIIVFFVEIISLSAVVSSVISFIILSLVLYFLSYKWVFKFNGSHSQSFPKFIATEIITLVMNTLIMYLVIEVFLFDYFYGIIATTLIIPLTNLLLNFFWSFKE